MGGYYIVFWVLRLHADKQITYQLDSNQYDPGETIEIKVPVTLPYPIYSNDFERVDGRFEHEGESFKLVKHKYENDTLYIICIRDHATQELLNTMDNYVELTQALPSTNEKAWNFLSKFLKDYFSHEGVNILHQYGFSSQILFAEGSDLFTPPLITIQTPPPKL